MHPTCSLDGCLEEQAAELTLTLWGASGAVKVELCRRHAGAVLSLMADLTRIVAALDDARAQYVEAEATPHRQYGPGA